MKNVLKLNGHCSTITLYFMPEFANLLIEYQITLLRKKERNKSINIYFNLKQLFFMEHYPPR